MITVPPNFNTRYMFSVQADIASYRVGESPEGSRVDIEYRAGGRVSTNADLFFESWKAELTLAEGELKKSKPTFSLPTDSVKRAEWLQATRRLDKRPSALDWLGLEGELISGSDWILVRSDGVAVMSGHATLREETWQSPNGQKELGGNIINVDLMTVADVGEAAVPSFAAPTKRAAALDPKQVYEHWKSSTGESELHFVLAIRFAVADSTQPWAGSTYGSLEGFERFVKLPRHQYAGNAKAKLMGSLLTHIELDVWRIGFDELPLGWKDSRPVA